MDILNDLDSYLARLSDETNTSDDVDLGSACDECKSAPFPLVYATTNTHRECLKEMLSTWKGLDLTAVLSEKGATLAHLAVRKGDLRTLQLLLQVDESLCQTGDINGATPLHVCSYHGHLDCLAWLLEKGACTDQKDSNGATAVHFAAASGHLDCLKLLIQRGKGNSNEQTLGGETPVYFAAQEGHLDCVQWLVEHANADPFLASNDGMTPLHATAQTGQRKVIHWLVRSAKCWTTCRTCDGATPVHFAAAKGHVAILEWMLHHSLATGTERDDFDATPVHDAAEQGQLECLYVFFNHSVDLHQKDCDGCTPKDLAEERGHKKCISFLENPGKVIRTEKRRTIQDADAAELGLLVPRMDQLLEQPSSSPATKAKKKRAFSFLSKIKGSTGTGHGSVK